MSAVRAARRGRRGRGIGHAGARRASVHVGHRGGLVGLDAGNRI
jgi:hypothetical protein